MTPDMIAVRYDAANKRYIVDAWEFASGAQKSQDLRQKIVDSFASLQKTLPDGSMIVPGEFWPVPKEAYVYGYTGL